MESSGQTRQVVAPTAPEYFPDVQSSHAYCNPGPATFLYFPATHSMHVAPFCPLKPALHIQAVFVVLPLAEVEEVGQSEHGALPVALLYFPATHAEHVPPFGPS